ncbi:MAG: hypothetical protein JWN70_6754 [Planctomycetaceae bacterium]|nr:hypothetical protein [Planctomycetaceae bacterium]
MPEPEKKPHIALVVGWLFLFLASVTTEFFTVRIFLQAIQIQSWPTAPGVVTRSNLETKFEGTITYQANIEYDFTIEGKSYSSSSIRTRGASNQHERDIAALVEKFPVGTAVKVYYNQQDPTESYLEAGVDFGNYIIIVSPIVFAVLFGTGFWGLMKTYRKFNTLGRIDGDSEQLDDLQTV